MTTNFRNGMCHIKQNKSGSYHVGQYQFMAIFRKLLPILGFFGSLLVFSAILGVIMNAGGGLEPTKTQEKAFNVAVIEKFGENRPVFVEDVEREDKQ